MKRFVRSSLLGLALVAGGGMFGGNAQAATLDCSVTPGVCTGAAGTSTLDGNTVYLFDGAYWATTDTQSTGTGVIDSFVRIQGGGGPEAEAVTQGMNTTARPLNQDENNSPQFTHDIQGVNIPVVAISGAQYYEFLLDINESNNSPSNLQSLSGVKLCTSATGSQTLAAGVNSCDDGAGGNSNVLGYSTFDTTTDEVRLNYSFNSGSGSGDLFMYLPAIGGADASTYFYLWSRFGEPKTQDAGFEEWAVRTANPISSVPEPASLLLFGTGLASLGRLARKKVKH